ncbi:uncharacterized protein LOC130273222 isoform X1 [Hyla sarda]|uniref:uncharacterized protein LOC130273222 isoform X1 n=1 Tax=Hyla sarda TaxID=327740 RepID=UPI0024C31BFF|nr:uncharacterized protein LOC130273222 isoform X1 [Hyla sarda]
METSEAQSANIEANNNDHLQNLVDNSVARSVQSAMLSAVTVLQDSIQKSISLALAHPSTSNPKTPGDLYFTPETSVADLAKGFNVPKKATSKKRHTHDGTAPPPKKQCKGGRQDKLKDRPIIGHDKCASKPHTLPSAQEEVSVNRAHKTAKRNKPNSFTEPNSDDSSDSQAEEIVDSFDYLSQESGEINDDPDYQEDDPLEESDLSSFDPALIQHPRSGEWLPNPIVAKFLSIRVNKSMDKVTRSKLKAECPRPTLPHLSSITPELDPVLNKFLMKTGKNPKKGIDRSFKSCQDKLLDILGPLSKILDMVEESSISNKPVEVEVLKGWAQRAVCFLGNANAALSTERKRSVLMRIDPQLTNLASNEPTHPTEGMLFGEDFINQIGKYVGLFSSINKAQTSLKKVFSNRVFGRAGKGRSRSSGRYLPTRQQSRGSFQHQYQPYQPSYTTQPANPTPFFPYRARPWRPRGQRGFQRAKPTTAT